MTKYDEYEATLRRLGEFDDGGIRYEFEDEPHFIEDFFLAFAARFPEEDWFPENAPPFDWVAWSGVSEEWDLVWPDDTWDARQLKLPFLPMVEAAE